MSDGLPARLTDSETLSVPKCDFRDGVFAFSQQFFNTHFCYEKKLNRIIKFCLFLKIAHKGAFFMLCNFNSQLAYKMRGDLQKLENMII